MLISILTLTTALTGSPLGGLPYNCTAESIVRPVPRSGPYFVQDQPGTGVVLAIQNCRIVGYLLNFDDSGAASWQMFSGPLDRGIAEGAWRFEGRLLELSGGQCLGCDYSLPEINPGRRLTLDFRGLSRAELVIEDTEPVSLVALEFGTTLHDVFSDGNVTFPLLDGIWTLSYSQETGLVRGFSSVEGLEFSHGGTLSDEQRSLLFPISSTDTGRGELECSWLSDQTFLGCRIRVFITFFGEGFWLETEVPVEHVSADRIVVKSEGIVFDLRRLY